MLGKSIFLLATIAATVSATAVNPALFDPRNPLFPHAYDAQGKIQGIQDDINGIVAQVQWGYFEEVRDSSDQSIAKFESLATTIDALHAPILDDFRTLPDGSCRDNAEVLINMTRTQTGFNAGNCATRLDNTVTGIIDNAAKLFENFNRQFSEIQQIVVKSFIKSNLFVDLPTDVMNKMDANHDLVKSRWDELKPSFLALRQQLKSDLAAADVALATCQQGSLDLANGLYSILRDQISVCREFSRSRPGPNSDRNFIQEALDFIAKFE